MQSHPSPSHPDKVDASVGVPEGELDGFGEHRHVAPRQDGRVPPAEADAPQHGGVRVVRRLVAHAPCGGGWEAETRCGVRGFDLGGWGVDLKIPGCLPPTKIFLTPLHTLRMVAPT